MAHGPDDRRLVARSKVWVERDGVVLISEYRARLLEAIRRHGSVAQAAESLGLPYRTAWKKLREMEAAAGEPILESGSGGAGGGQSRLTAVAVEMLDAFNRLAEPARREVDARFGAEARHFAGASGETDTSGTP